MKRLEFSGAVRPLYESLGFKGLMLMVRASRKQEKFNRSRGDM